MDGTEILSRLLPLALHRSDARQTEAPSRPLSEARLRRPERSPSRARRRLAPAMAGRELPARHPGEDLETFASSFPKTTAKSSDAHGKTGDQFLQPPALPDPPLRTKEAFLAKASSIPLEPAPSRSCRRRPAEGRASSSRPSRRSRPPRTGRSRRCRCSCPSG